MVQVNSKNILAGDKQKASLSDVQIFDTYFKEKDEKSGEKILLRDARDTSCGRKSNLVQIFGGDNNSEDSQKSIPYYKQVNGPKVVGSTEKIILKPKKASQPKQNRNRKTLFSLLLNRNALDLILRYLSFESGPAFDVFKILMLSN